MLDIKGAVFDMDGTILNSMKLWEEIDVEFLSKRGFEVPKDYMSSIAHLGAYDTAVYTIERFSLNDTPTELIDEWQNSAIKKYPNILEKQGITAYMKRLKKRGVKIAVATATSPLLVNAALKDREIFNYIDCITTSDEVKRGKGFPDIYYKCCEKLGLEPRDCVVFEDIVMGIKGAKDGGFKTVAVYDECSKNDRQTLTDLADKYIYDFDEML